MRSNKVACTLALRLRVRERGVVGDGDLKKREGTRELVRCSDPRYINVDACSGCVGLRASESLCIRTLHLIVSRPRTNY